MALVWHISPALAPSGAAEQQKVAPGKGGGGSQADVAPTGEGRGGEGPGHQAMCPGLLRFPAWARRSPPGPQRSAAQQRSGGETR